MQVAHNRVGNVVKACIVTFLVSSILTFVAQNAVTRILLQDPLFSVGWSMLDAAKAQQRLDGGEFPADSSLRIQLSNIDFYYTHILSSFRAHPSFAKLSAAYRDFLVASGQPASEAASKLFLEAAASGGRKGLFYRDFLDPNKW